MTGFIPLTDVIINKDRVKYIFATSKGLTVYFAENEKLLVDGPDALKLWKLMGGKVERDEPRKGAWKK